MTSFLRTLKSFLSPLASSRLPLTNSLTRTFVAATGSNDGLSKTPSFSIGSSWSPGFLLPKIKIVSTQPIRHGTAGSYGTREWLICRHWAVPVPSFYGPVRYNLLNGESVGVRKVFISFKRLNNGMWIRTVGGRHKRLYLRSPTHRAAMRKHIMCTSGENKRLDLMVRAHMLQPKYYVDDPYHPYQKRNGIKDVYYKQKEFYP